MVGHFSMPFDIHELEAVTHHVHQAELDIGMRKDRCDGIRKALEAVHADNEDVVHSTVLEFRDHLEPELGTFGLGDPKTEQFLLSTQIDPQGQIYGFDPHGLAVPHFDVDAIQIDDGVQGFQRARLPGLDVLNDRVGDSGNERR